jgi:hypothetical protein
MTKSRILVLGYIVRGPIGGMAWHHLQYVLGLHQLGYDVYFVEDSDDYDSCYDPSRGVVDENPSYGLAFCDHVFRHVGLADRWCYYDAHHDRWHGPAASNAGNLFQTCDVLLNVSGVNPLRDWALCAPVRAFIDTDPVFTQVRHLMDATARNRAAQHNVFFTFGEAIPEETSLVPDDGIAWQATRQPIVLNAWPLSEGNPAGRFTTVMQWDSYPAVECAGQRYEMKSRSFESFMQLPALSCQSFELAVGGASAPRERLRSQGWHLRDSLQVTRDPWTYQRYLQESKAEFGIAKHGYVASHCGWFSERSAAYLASGRPCLVQDTGFSDHLPTGSGLVAFRTLDDVLAALEEIETRYSEHCRAARGLAEDHFDSRLILDSLLNRLSPSSP